MIWSAWSLETARVHAAVCEATLPLLQLVVLLLRSVLFLFSGRSWQGGCAGLWSAAWSSSGSARSAPSRRRPCCTPSCWVTWSAPWRAPCGTARTSVEWGWTRCSGVCQGVCVRENVCWVCISVCEKERDRQQRGDRKIQQRESVYV